VPHCNREEFVSVAKPDCRFSHTLAVYLLQRLVFTKTLRLFEDRLHRGLLSPVSAKVHFGLTREEPHVKTPNSNANRSHESATCVRERQPGHISGATVARIEA
jgi:hypothetical protein